MVVHAVVQTAVHAAARMVAHAVVRMAAQAATILRGPTARHLNSGFPADERISICCGAGVRAC